MSNYEVLLFSDLHLNEWSLGSYTDPLGQNTRLTHGLKVLDHVYKKASERGISEIIFTGDLFHKRNSVTSQVLDRTIKTLALLTKTYPSISLTLLLGNHDLSRDGLYSSVKSLGLIPGVRVIFSCQDIKFFNGEILCRFIPFTPDPRSFKDSFCKSRVDVVFAHQGFGGLDSDPRNYYIDEIAQTSDLKSWSSSKVDIISGHHHDHYWISRPENLVSGFFVGAPTQQNFGDVGCRRGFLTYVLGSRRPEVHNLNSCFPQFVDVTPETPISEVNIYGNYVRCLAEDHVMPDLLDHVASFEPEVSIPKYVSSSVLGLPEDEGENSSYYDNIVSYVMDRGKGLNRQELIDMYNRVL